MEQLSKLVDEIITETSKKNSADLFQNFMDHVKSHSSSWIKDNFGSIRIDIVIDANAVISTINRYVKNESSILFHLDSNPIFSLYAPTELKSEILKYIESDKIQRKLKKKWFKGLRVLESIIQFKNSKDIKIKKRAVDIIGKKDPKDVPYVELYLDIKATMILTSDKHFEHKDIHKYNIVDLIETTGIIQKGILSHHIVNKSIPAGMSFLKTIILALFKKIYGVIKQVFKTTKSKMANICLRIIEFIEKRSNFQKFLIAGTVVLLIFTVIFFKTIRNKIIQMLGSLTNSTTLYINKIFTFLKKFTRALLDFIIYVAPQVAMLIKSLISIIGNMKKEFRDLTIENAFA